MDCATHSGATAVSSCTRCERPVCSACRQTLDGRDYCSSCVADLRASLAAPAADGTVAEPGPTPIAAAPIVAAVGIPVKGVLFAVVAGLMGALVWYGVVAMTDMKLGIIAIGVGWLVGRGAVLGAGTGGKQLAVASLVIAVLAMVLGEYLTVNHAVHAYFARERPDAVLPALLSPAKLIPIYAGGFGPMDILFYAIGAWEALRFPLRAQTRS
jgi:hypothetical protein